MNKSTLGDCIQLGFQNIFKDLSYLVKIFEHKRNGNVCFLNWKMLCVYIIMFIHLCQSQGPFKVLQTKAILIKDFECCSGLYPDCCVSGGTMCWVYINFLFVGYSYGEIVVLYYMTLVLHI